MLNTDPRRIKAEKCLEDMDKVAMLMYACAIRDHVPYIRKMKEYIKAWSFAYISDGNSINENKLTPLFCAYYLIREYFDKQERHEVEKWMMIIAQKEKDKKKRPNNNWEAKRIKIIQMIGIVLNDAALVQYAVDGIKKYVNTSLFPDGTSNDLKTRDALSYHVGGLTPMVVLAINHEQYTGIDLFAHESPTGASIKKSVDLVVPYAKGEKVYLQWRNSKASIDKARARAGIKKYQPGVKYEPAEACKLLQLSAFFDPMYREALRDVDCDGHQVVNGIISKIHR
jgi:hypothetical protein